MARRIRQREPRTVRGPGSACGFGSVRPLPWSARSPRARSISSSTIRTRRWSRSARTSSRSAAACTSPTSSKPPRTPPRLSGPEPTPATRPGTSTQLAAWSHPAPAVPSSPASAAARRQSSGVLGQRFSARRSGGVTIVAFPVSQRLHAARGAACPLLAPEVLADAINGLRDPTGPLRPCGAGCLIAVLIGFQGRLADHLPDAAPGRSRRNMAAGALDVPLRSPGRDEVGDLARALDKMRAVACRQLLGPLFGARQAGGVLRWPQRRGDDRRQNDGSLRFKEAVRRPTSVSPTERRRRK